MTSSGSPACSYKDASSANKGSVRMTFPADIDISVWYFLFEITSPRWISKIRIIQELTQLKFSACVFFWRPFPVEHPFYSVQSSNNLSKYRSNSKQCSRYFSKPMLALHHHRCCSGITSRNLHKFNFRFYIVSPPHLWFPKLACSSDKKSNIPDSPMWA